MAQMALEESLHRVEESLHIEVTRATAGAGAQGTWRGLATGEEMKVFLLSVLVLLAAATALAVVPANAASSLTTAAGQVADRTGEPATLLLSGSILLGLAGAVKRFTV